MKYEKGTKVTITKNLRGSKTERGYQLDSTTGNMLNMTGKTFKVGSCSDSVVSIYCEEASRSYTFDIDDVERFVPEIPEQNFIFDEKCLDT